MRRLLRLGAAAGSGALLSCAYHPLDVGILAWFAAAPLFVLARLDDGRGFVIESHVFGFTLFSIGGAWLYGLTPVAGLLMSFLVGLLFFVPFAWTLRAVLRDRRVPLLVAGPLVWLTFDWVRTWLASGFPWFYLAHSQWSHPAVIRISAWTGAYGLTFAMAGVNAAIALAILRLLRRPEPSFVRAWWAVPGGALLLVLAASFTSPPEVEKEPFRLAIVQGNVPQGLKSDAIERPRKSATGVLRDHLVLTRDAVADARGLWGAPPDLVLWAETTLPGWPGWPYDPEVRRLVGRVAGTPAMMGVLIREGEPRKRTTNSALLVDAKGEILGRYDKVRPVPGSEYLPYRSLLPDDFVEWAGDVVYSYAGFRPVQSPGESLDPLVVPTPTGDRAVGALICYEVIYPGLSREMAARGAQALVNLTNYGWFGQSAQLDQAEAITVFRAVETGRPVVVCANSGISSVISPEGRVVARLTREGRVKSVEGWLLAEIPVASDPASADTPYLAIGDVPVIAIAIATTLLLAVAILGRIGIVARPLVERVRGRESPGVSS